MEERPKKERAVLFVMLLCCVNLLLWFAVFSFIVTKVSYIERKVRRVEGQCSDSRMSAIVHNDDWVSSDELSNFRGELLQELEDREERREEEVQRITDLIRSTEMRCEATESAYHRFLQFWENLKIQVRKLIITLQ